MLLTNNKGILMFALEEAEEQELKNLVKGTLTASYIPKFITIEKSMVSMKVGDILGGLNLAIHNSPVPEVKTILFHNLEDREIQAVVREIRSKLSAKPILAVVTETSIQWSFGYLLEHLIEERESFKKNQQEV